MEYEESFNVYKDSSIKSNVSESNKYKSPSYKPKTFDINKAIPEDKPSFDLSDKEKLELYDLVLDYIIPKNLDPNMKSLSKVVGAFILDDVLSNYFKK